MKTKLLAVFLLAGSSLFAGVAVRIGVGVPAYGYYVATPPPVVAAPAVTYASPYPGPAYSWVAGYWYPVGPRWYWRAGYWAPRPFAHAYWVAPRYYGHRYYDGHWRR